MPRTVANGINFHYQQIGSGPDVVMIHGLTGNLAIWHLGIIPALMDRYRLTSYDLRGHGYSEAPPTGYTTADHAADLHALLQVLDIEQAVIAGHSFGADIALHFSLLYPQSVRKLVLVEPGIPALKHLREREDWPGWRYWRERLRDGGVEVPAEKYYDAEYLVRASIGIPKIFGFRKGYQRRPTPLTRLMNETTAAHDYGDPAGMTLDRLTQVCHPSLLIYGEETVFLDTYEYLRNTLPDCQAVLLQNAEHFGPLEQPAALIDLLAEFLPEPLPTMDTAYA